MIIVGRGGGSLEDLWAFNTEQVARAVFECETPIISAVGHETDYTICDFVSDLRAPTPSAAAELAVPDSATLINYFDGIKNRLLSYLHNKIDKEYQRLDNLLINTPLENMNDFINLKYDDLAVLQTRLVDAYSYFIEQKNNEFKNKVSRLDTLSPLKILLRGYTTYNFLRKAFHIIKIVLVTIVVLIGAAFITLQSPRVQTFVANKVTAKLKESVPADIRIGKIHLRPFNTLVAFGIGITHAA